MTTNKQRIDQLKVADPEALATALKEILDYIAPLIEANPEVKWGAFCPESIILAEKVDDTYANFDAAWSAGQDNGEVHAANHVQSILDRALDS